MLRRLAWLYRGYTVVIRPRRPAGRRKAACGPPASPITPRVEDFKVESDFLFLPPWARIRGSSYRLLYRSTYRSYGCSPAFLGTFCEFFEIP